MKNTKYVLFIFLCMVALGTSACGQTGNSEDEAYVASLHDKIDALQQELDAGNPIPADSTDTSNDSSKSSKKNYSDPNDKFKPLCVEASDCLYGQLCSKGQCQDDPNAEKQNASDQGPQVAKDATYSAKLVSVAFDQEVVFDNVLRDSLEVDGGAFYAVSVKPQSGNKKIAVFELQDLPKEGVPYKFVLSGGDGKGPKGAKNQKYMTTDRVWHHTYGKIDFQPFEPVQQQ